MALVVLAGAASSVSFGLSGSTDSCSALLRRNRRIEKGAWREGCERAAPVLAVGRRGFFFLLGGGGGCEVKSGLMAGGRDPAASEGKKSGRDFIDPDSTSGV